MHTTQSNSQARGAVWNEEVGTLPLERKQIECLMPHAPSWVQIDRVLECRPPVSIRTQKQVRPTDPFVEAHFPAGPALLPGVMLVEYVSQSAYLLARLADPQRDGPGSVRLLARCSASFLSPAWAGDVLTAETRLSDAVGDVTVYEGTVCCGQRVVCRVKVFAASPSGAAAGSECMGAEVALVDTKRS